MLKYHSQLRLINWDFTLTKFVDHIIGEIEQANLVCLDKSI